MIDDAHDPPRATIQPQQLRAILAQIVAKTGVPGMSAAVFQNGHITAAAAGLRSSTTPAPMCTDSRFALGSTGKFLTCVAALELITSQQLDCDAPLRTYLPELADSEMGNDVALANLMSHTSGYYQTAEGIFDDVLGFDAQWESVVQRSISARRLFAPGAVFSYDTPNYVLCGEILRRACGNGPRELIRAHLLQPLGIEEGATDGAREDSGYVEGHVASLSGGFAPTTPSPVSELWQSATSNMTLSMPNIVAIAASVMGVPIDSEKVLSAAARDMLLTQLVDVPIAPEWPVRDCAAVSYGLGCAAHRNGLFGHPGETGSQCCALHFDPVRKIALAVGVNARAFQAREVALTMLMRAMGYASKHSGLKRTSFDRGELSGNYVGGAMGRVFEVRTQGSQLICRLLPRRGTEGAGTHKKPFPVVSLHITDEGHAVLDENSRQVPLCFFRESGGTTPCLMVGQAAYRQL